MVELIVGKKGKGKTKVLLDKVNGVGFICGILSQDHDLEQVYLDSFLKVAKLEEKDITGTLGQLDEIGKQFNVTFVISVSLDKEEVPEAFHDKIAVAL